MADRLIRIRRCVRRAETWLWRAKLVPGLGQKLKMQAFPRGYAVLYAVDCSPEEEQELAAISEGALLRLRRGMEVYSDSTLVIARIQVLCFGRRARVDRAPTWIRRWLTEPFGAGVWLRELNAALVFFQENVPIRRIVLHELSHGLLDRLTDGFPYPIAIQEGFARRAEYFVPGEDGVSEWKRSYEACAQASCCFDQSAPMTIRDLLTFDWRNHWRRDMSAFTRMTGWAFWLNLYVETLGPDGALLKAILPQLRKCNNQTPMGVYEWLHKATGMNEVELEAGFRAFCDQRAAEVSLAEGRWR